jgi:hypothetical protein
MSVIRRSRNKCVRGITTSVAYTIKNTRLRTRQIFIFLFSHYAFQKCRSSTSRSNGVQIMRTIVCDKTRRHLIAPVKGLKDQKPIEPMRRDRVEKMPLNRVRSLSRHRTDSRQQWLLIFKSTLKYVFGIQCYV